MEIKDISFSVTHFTEKKRTAIIAIRLTLY